MPLSMLAPLLVALLTCFSPLATYDTLGDVLSTESAGGADRHEFTRTQPSSTRLVRTVKGPLGHVATYGV